MSNNNYDGRIITEKDKVIYISKLENDFISYMNIEGNYRVVDKEGNIIVDFDDKIKKTYLFNDRICLLNKENVFYIMTFTGDIIFTRTCVEDFRAFYDKIVLEHNVFNKVLSQVINNDGTEIEDSAVIEKCYFGNLFVTKLAGEDVRIYNWRKDCYLKMNDYTFNDVTKVEYKSKYMLLYGTINNVKNRVAFMNESTLFSIFSDKYDISFGPEEEVLIQSKRSLVLFNNDGELLLKLKGHGLMGVLEPYGIRIYNSRKHIMYMLYDQRHVVDFKDEVVEFTMSNPNLYAYRHKNFDYRIADVEDVIPDRFIEDIKGIYLTPDRIYMLRRWQSEDISTFKNILLSTHYYPTFCHDFSIYDSKMNRLAFDLGNGAQISWDCFDDMFLLNIDGKKTYFDKNGKKYNEQVKVLSDNEVYKIEPYCVLLNHPDISKSQIEEYKNSEISKEKKSSQFKKLVL